tara:strand:- start:533 stop:1201 length:669 start_codon:yes stop_codon:yes gene_type:complete
MKNIILQHYTGELGELEKLSQENIKKYAEFCNAEYQLVQGNLLKVDGLDPQCQKIYMLDEVWDEYDCVVMMDIDMFTRKGMTKNIFTDAKGYGRHFGIQDMLHNKMVRNFPDLSSLEYPYWGGSIYRLPKALRQELRKHITNDLLKRFKHQPHDEGIMHCLAVKAKIPIEGAYLDEQNWNYSSFDYGVENANIIHIRTKIWPNGPTRPKIENYKALVERGLI